MIGKLPPGKTEYVKTGIKTKDKRKTRKENRGSIINIDMEGNNVQEEDSFMQTEEVKDDWRDSRSLAECAEHLSQTKVMSDVTFTFKTYSHKKLQAHRLILSMRSAIFEAMFFGPMAGNQAEIEIEDIEPDIYDLVLRYIYTDKTTLNGDTVLKCLYAARKYCLCGLVKLCSDFLENSITMDNVCTIYEQAKFFDVDELKQKCYSFIVEKSTEVFQNDDIAKLTYDSLLLILADEGLQSEEILHFQMAIRWADRKCNSENIEASGDNMRNVLGDILSKIRFPVMAPETFATEVVPTKVLTPEEQVQMLQFMVTRTTETPGYVGKYISLPRRDSSLEVDLKNVGSFGTKEAYTYMIKMISNYDITLASVGKLSATFRNFSYVCEEDKSLTRKSKGTDFVCSNGQYYVKDEVKKEVRLLANKHYILGFNNTSVPLALRNINHVATFGEISIIITQATQGINTLSFCRVFSPESDV